MAIAGLTYLDDRRRSSGPNADGVHADGLGWLAESTQFFAGYMAGDIRYDYGYEVYAGAESWGDGSRPMAAGSRSMKSWRLRNALRSCKAAFLTVSASLQTAAAEELGGVYVADPVPAWLDAPPESDPEPAKED